MLKDEIKILLDIEDTTLYDQKLDILIPSASSKLKIEGIVNRVETDPDYYLYVNCISYWVASDIDIDVDMDKLLKKYLTSAVQLRGG